jgi:hypothetical protein
MALLAEEVVEERLNRQG